MSMVWNADWDLLLLAATMALCGLVPAVLAQAKLKGEAAPERAAEGAGFFDAGLRPAVVLVSGDGGRARPGALGEGRSVPALACPRAGTIGARGRVRRPAGRP